MKRSSLVGRQVYGFITATFGVMALFISASILRAQSVDMQYVTVGNPGNSPDMGYLPGGSDVNGIGEVDYTYNIGEYDVTDPQYVTFLNAVDPTGANSLGLYSAGYRGEYGIDYDAEYGISFDPGAPNGMKYSTKSGFDTMPVVDVDLWDAIRFTNWMDDGNTETGAYTLLGETPTPTNANTVTRNAGATVWLPNQDEWFKAGYYDPNYGGTGVGGYWAYATQSNSFPGNIIGNGPNEANIDDYGVYSVTQSTSFDPTQNYLTPVGSFTNSSSYYGTYDQEGDASNWTDTAPTDDGLIADEENWAGGPGVFVSDDPSSYQFDFGSIGFRVASVAAVPEPSTWPMIAAGAGVLVIFRRRRS